MLKHNSQAINAHSNTQSSHCKFGACQKLEPAGRIGDFGNLLNVFAKITLFDHYYPAYPIGADCSD